MNEPVNNAQPTEGFDSIPRRLAEVQRYLQEVQSLPLEPIASTELPAAEKSNGASVASVAPQVARRADTSPVFVRPRVAHPSSPPPEFERVAWPAPPAPDAFYGLPGDVVRTIEPHTESDPVAILVQFLGAFGNVIGSSAHFQVEGDVHRTNLFAVMVGPSAKARKGTSWGWVRRLAAASAPEIAVETIWHSDCIKSGLSSGEGLIFAVRDPTEDDDGVVDKRLLVVESEFSRPLVSMRREGNVLSEVIRQSWDSPDLYILNKNSPAKATGAHISIVGHVTDHELRRHLSNTEQANGFANRFLWVCVRRSKELPDGGALTDDALRLLAERMRQAIAFGSATHRMVRDSDAQELWREEYSSLSAGKPGLLGSIISRAEAQVLRLSIIYALLDRSPVIRVEHLRAALALWRYCEDSVRYIFGDALGDPVADKILEAFRNSGAEGMTRTEIRDLFNNHQNETNISKALSDLEALGLAKMVSEPTGGRSAERWFATGQPAT